ncbi:MAG: class I SAM-dependent methyltransferase, partial [Alphaproteobacteria bacterium]|nr:class I SAM-dependent methyltransferase [Alphaproteobacteria bacterium]
MSGFSADWLALRAPFDAAARNDSLTRRFLESIDSGGLVADLGGGTGGNVANLRPRAPSLRWRIVDIDRRLLDVARERFSGIGSVEYLETDLTRALVPALDGAAAVTCSAILDLTSAGWIDALVATLAARRLPALVVLSYDGRLRWDPPDVDDARIADAFHRDMVRDKGFGPSLGPDAVAYARRAFADAGARVEQAASDWRIPRNAEAMLTALVD